MALWLAAKPLVLASQSKVRRALIEAAGIPVETRPAHLDERAIEQQVKGGPAEVALTLAREKARTVAAMSGPAYVVGCDQTPALGERDLRRRIVMAARISYGDARQAARAAFGRSRRRNAEA